MNLHSLTQIQDFSDKRVLLPISGGINSAAVLCFLGKYFPKEFRPQTLYLYYSHFEEHSPGTLRFVRDCLRYAREHFETVVCGYNRASVNEFFISQKMIPHPTKSPCSRLLKREPAAAFFEAHACEVQLIGYVSNELRRYKRSEAYGDKSVQYPILEFTEDDCFDLVKDEIGWYPAIYDIRWTMAHFEAGLCSKRDVGRRVFLHNNCLPCKNMTVKQMMAVGLFFPPYARRAELTAQKIPNAYWGRDDVPDIFKCDYCERNQ